jgi:hypothetical protein
MGPALGAGELRSRLLSGALDLGPAGADNLTGAGRLRMPTTAPTPLGYVGGSATAGSITVSTSVNPNGIAADAFLQYGPTTGYGSQSHAVPVGYGTTPTSSPPITIDGLAPATDYHVRLVARNPFGQVTFTDAVLSTNGPPVVTSATMAAEAGGNAAALQGTVNSRGLPTTAYYEYGTTTAYGRQTPAVSTGTTIPTAWEFGQVVGALAPDTTYQYRLVAENAAGKVVGQNATFATGPGLAPTVTTGSAGSVGHSSATVSATVDSGGNLGTTVRVEYGPTTAYGTSTAPTDVPFSTAPQPLSIPVSGLAPTTTYHYRVIAAGPFGTAVGADGTFTTAQAPPPPSGGGGGGGGGGVDLALSGGVEPLSAPVGGSLTWRLRVTDKTGALGFGVFVDVQLPTGVTLGATSADRGPGCNPTGTNRLRCSLDFLSAAAPVGNVTLNTSVAAAGELVLVATAGYSGTDPTPADNSLTLRANTPTATVTAPRPPTRTPTAAKGVTRRGTAQANMLRGTRFVDRLFGLAGSDRLFGLAGADTIDGGGGNDRLFGGPGGDRLVGRAGADLLDGGTGNDLVLARDRTRDVVRCGPGRDSARVDRSDRVAGDCELVQRR